MERFKRLQKAEMLIPGTAENRYGHALDSRFNDPEKKATYCCSSQQWGEPARTVSKPGCCGKGSFPFTNFTIVANAKEICMPVNFQACVQLHGPLLLTIRILRRRVEGGECIFFNLHFPLFLFPSFIRELKAGFPSSSVLCQVLRCRSKLG